MTTHDSDMNLETSDNLEDEFNQALQGIEDLRKIVNRWSPPEPGRDEISEQISQLESRIVQLETDINFQGGGAVSRLEPEGDNLVQSLAAIVTELKNISAKTEKDAAADDLGLKLDAIKQALEALKPEQQPVDNPVVAALESIATQLKQALKNTSSPDHAGAAVADSKVGENLKKIAEALAPSETLNQMRPNNLLNALTAIADSCRPANQPNISLDTTAIKEEWIGVITRKT